MRLNESPARQLSVLVPLLRLHTDSRPVSLSDARRQVRTALAQTRLSTQAVGEMDVATGEILSNTYMHAYNSGVGPVHVEVFHLHWTVTVLIIDMGSTTVAPAVPQALHNHTRSGGRGLYLASRMCDKLAMRINTASPGLTVRMTKWFEDGLIQAERARQYRRFRPSHGDGFQSIRDVWATTSTA